MNLINKFSVWYVGITIVVLTIGSVLIFESVQDRIVDSEIDKLRSSMREAGQLIRNGTPVTKIKIERIDIAEIDRALPETEFHVEETTGWFSKDEGMENQIRAYRSIRHDGKQYMLSGYYFLPESDKIGEGVMNSVLQLFVVLIVVTAICGRMISRRLLSPLHKTLYAIESFKLSNNKKIELPSTSTTEFKKMNELLEKMVTKANADYRLTKEFTENASHELQTPLAVILAKIELLLELALNDQQAKLISSTHDEIEKLSRMNQSLLLLAKLDNQQYEKRVQNVSKLIEEVVETGTELATMSGLVITHDIERDVIVNVNLDLIRIMVNNLLQNSIRHNISSGRIHISLNKQRFLIQNTGAKPESSPSQFFQRFKKGNQSLDSTGLGLSIVKQICKIHDFDIDYLYQNEYHVVVVQLIK